MSSIEKKLQEVLDQATESGEECGCQLAIYEKGKLVLNLVSGYTSVRRDRKVTPDTLFPVYSCGKGLMATAVHQLVEKGILHYEDRIADVWPEFGCRGKENIRLWQVMSHRTGLHELPELDSFDQIADWDFMCRKIEEASPENEPGTVCHYQPVTYAWLVGETVRRAAGTGLRELIQKNILEPLRIRNFCFGTTPEQDARCAEVDESGLPENMRPGFCRNVFHSMTIRHGFVPSANGCASAEALARHYSALVTETDGVRLLKPETLENALRLCRWEKDPVPLADTWEKFGLGYVLGGQPGKNLSSVFGHGGALGGEGFADLERGIAVGFTKNMADLFDDDQPVRNRLSQVMGIPCRRW